MSRIAELKTSQVATNKIRLSEDTQRNMSELEEATTASRAVNGMKDQERDGAAQNSTAGAEEQSLDETSRRRTPSHRTRRHRKDGIGDVMKRRALK